MRTALRTLVGLSAAGLFLAGAAGTAAAVDLAGWTANPGTSFDDGVVTLRSTPGGGTSYENPNLAVEIEDGDVLTFEYKLVDGALCAPGAPRVFVQLGSTGPADNTWDDDLGGDCGDAIEDGWFRIIHELNNVTPGPAGGTGIVNDNGSPGAILVRNVIINSVNVTGPTSVDGCKNGGWAGAYKNQGACVSEFTSNR